MDRHVVNQVGQKLSVDEPYGRWRRIGFLVSLQSFLLWQVDEVFVDNQTFISERKVKLSDFVNPGVPRDGFRSNYKDMIVRISFQSCGQRNQRLSKAHIEEHAAVRRSQNEVAGVLLVVIELYCREDSPSFFDCN